MSKTLINNKIKALVLNSYSEEDKNFKYCGLKVSFCLLLILFAYDLFGQVDFKNEGIIIEDTFGLISVKHSDSNNASTGNVIIEGFSKIDNIMNLDVLNYYDELKEKYNTELKMKFFKQSPEYLELAENLTVFRNGLKNSFILFSSPASKDVLSDYSLSTKSFSLEVMAGLSKSFGINGENHFVSNSFALDLLKIKTQRINEGFYESYYLTSLELVEKDEINALKIEENKNNILVYFITNIVDEKNLTKTEGFKEHRNVYFPSFYRILIFNKLTYEIYIDRLFTSNGEVNMQPKDIEKKNKIKFELANEQNKDKMNQDSINAKNKNRNIDSIKVFNKYIVTNNNQPFIDANRIGVFYSLSGRNSIYLPNPTNPNNNEEGIVVVEISVDQYGNVKRAVPGVKGTTNLNSALLNASKKAALSTTFSQNLESTALQIGTITYIFKNGAGADL
jgi:hypothetical protein